MLEAPPLNVAVCALTYRRPDGLKRLVEGLNALGFQRNQTPNLTVIIVDNDPSASAKQLCQSLSQQAKWPIKYVHEPRPGIAFGRNAAINSAPPTADFIAFIDDDEYPDPLWLDELLCAQKLYSADVILGRVIPKFEESAPLWAAKGQFFDRPQHKSGTALECAQTNNVLISSKITRDAGLRFDERFAWNNGDDTFFFMQVHRAHYSIVWTNEAIVYETIPRTRTDVRWLLQRAIRHANWYVHFERSLSPSLKIQSLRLAKSCIRILEGVLSVPFALFRGKAPLIKSFQKIALGTGMLLGLMRVELRLR
jgi:succinoglycan biosynthesis protein ExoM